MEISKEQKFDSLSHLNQDVGSLERQIQLRNTTNNMKQEAIVCSPLNCIKTRIESIENQQQHLL
jgi:hypothetical protein